MKISRSAMLIILTALILLGLVMCPSASAAGNIPIDSATFKNAAFRTYVADNFDTDGDGSLSPEEIAVVTVITAQPTRTLVEEDGESWYEIKGTRYASLRGIEVFTNLRELYCADNNMDSLDVSANTELSILDCSGNYLEELDLSGNTKLVKLYANNNWDLYDLDIGSCTALKVLDLAGDENISELELDGLTELVELDLSGMYCVEELDCTALANLQKLNLSGTSVNAPLLYNCTDLRELDLSGLLTTVDKLDVSCCPLLEKLVCDDIDLKNELYLAENTAITYLSCNDLPDLGKLDVSACRALKSLNCGNCGLDELDLSNNTELEYIYVSHNDLSELDLTGLTALTSIYADDNQLASLDVSMCGGLKYLGCSNNKIETLNREGVNGLVFLYCSNNELTSLDLTGCTGIVDFNCSYNKIGALDISAQEDMLYLNCNDNALTKLDIPAGLELDECEFRSQAAVLPVSFDSGMSIYTIGEGFDGADFGTGVYDPATGTVTFEGTVYGFKYGYPTGFGTMNVRVTADAEPESGIIIDGQRFPDDVFFDYVINNIDTDHDFLLSDAERSAVTVLNLEPEGEEYEWGMEYYGPEIHSFKGIELFTELEELYCGHNGYCEDNTLDLTANTKLRILSCPADFITHLYIGTCTELTEIDCSSNDMLKKLDVSNCTKLTKLNCSYDWLYSLDVSNCPDLRVLICNDCQLNVLDLSACNGLEELNIQWTAIGYLDISGNTALTELDASEVNGSLRELYLDGCTALTKLYCQSNQLLSLDLSGAPALTDVNIGYQYVKAEAYEEDGSTVFKVGKGLESTDFGSGVYDGAAGTVTFEGSVSEFEFSAPVGRDGTFLTGAVYGASEYEMEIPVNEFNFPDENFRTYVRNVYAYESPAMTVGDSLNVTKLNVSNKGIKSLKGIEFFPNITELDCSNNELTELDLGANTLLTIIDCSDNEITDLDVSSNTLLEELRCNGNRLTTLDVSNNTELFILNIRGNDLNEIDVGNNLSLGLFNCDDNKLTELDVSMLDGLTELTCSGNMLTELDISKHEYMFYLNCENNLLTSLDVSKNTSLGDIHCGGNGITELDVSNNTGLWYLYCERNALTRLDLSGNEELLELSAANQKAELPAVIVNGMTVFTIGEGFDNVDFGEGVYDPENGTVTFTGNVDGFTYDYPVCGENMDVTVMGKLPESIAIDETNFPDAVFRAYVAENFDTDGDGSLSETEILNADSIEYEGTWGDDPDNDIRSLEGIDKLTSLTRLSVQGACIEKLDLDENTALTYLDCSYNDIAELDVGNNTLLTYLDCSGNKLTSLDVGNNTALTYLGCYWNQLAALDVSKLTALTELRCYDNAIAELKVGNNTALTVLDCNTNALTSLDVSKNTELTELNCAANSLTALDVRANTKLILLACGYNGISSLDVSSCTQLETLFCSENELNTLDVSDNTALTTLDVGSNKLGELDVGSNTLLDALYCDDNLLTELDLSNNAALTALSCSRNSLGGLELGNNPMLDFVNCAYCGITEIDLSRNPALTRFTCSGNELGYIDVSYNKDLNSLYCDNTGLTELDVSGNEYLYGLDCSNNMLTELDLGGNAYLSDLYCSNNALTALDLTNKTELYCVDCSNNALTRLDITETDNLYIVECGGQKAELPAVIVNGMTVFTIGEGFEKANFGEGVYDSENGTVTFTGNVDGFTYDYPVCGENMDVTVTGKLPESIAIDETNFPDAQFRMCLTENPDGYDSIDLDGDGMLSAEEAAAVREISVFGHNIKSLKGIEYFPNLERLDFSFNAVAEIDLSGNPNLTELDCTANRLSELDLSGNPKLIWLSCGDNRLSRIDLGNNKALSYPNVNTQNMALRPEYADGTTVFTIGEGFDKANFGAGVYDPSNGTVTFAGEIDEFEYRYPTGYGAYTMTVHVMTALEGDVVIGEINFPDDTFREKLAQEFDYDGNGIFSAEERTFVRYLYCDNLNIKSLKGIEYFGNITDLSCSDNALKELDIRALGQLTNLTCENNYLASLDISGNGRLEYVSCSDNRLTKLDITACENMYDAYAENQNAFLPCAYDNGKSVFVIGAGFDNVDFGDGVYDPEAGTVSFDGIVYSFKYEYPLSDMQPMDVRVTVDTAPEGYLLIDENAFRDTAFCRYVGSKLDTDGDGMLSPDEISAVTVIDVSRVYDYESDEFRGPDIRDLTGIEVFGNLAELYCNHTNMTEVDITGIASLRKLDCSNSTIETVKVAGCTGLTELICSSNVITSLDVGGCTALTRIDCANNRLTSLDLSGCTALTDVTVGKQTAYIAATIGNGVSVYDIGAGLTEADFGSGVYDSAAGTVTFEGEVPSFTYTIPVGFGSVNMTVKVKAEGYVAPDIVIDASVFPDDVFRAYILEQIDNGDGILTNNERKSTHEIDISRYFMEYADEYDDYDDRGPVKSLEGIELFEDLMWLRAEYNDITELDLSGHDSLYSVSLSNNPLTKLELGGSATLRYLYLANTPITELDLDGLTNLMTLKIDHSGIRYTNFGMLPSLRELNCSGNGLTVLDLSGNGKLTSLWCSDNSLSALDLSNNHELAYLNCENNEISELELSECAKLNYVWFSNNNVTELDLSACAAVFNGIYGSNNPLTTLGDLSGKQVLYIECENCSLTKLDIGYFEECNVAGQHVELPAEVVDGDTVFTIGEGFDNVDFGEGVYDSENGTVTFTGIVDGFTYYYPIGELGYSKMDVTVNHIHTLSTVRPVPAAHGTDGTIGAACCAICGERYYEGTVVISGNAVFTLPADLKVVEEEAFSGLGMQQVIVPADVEIIKANAFGGCTELKLAIFEGKDTVIETGAFGADVTFICPESSAAEEYAEANGIACFN